jgi:hypothetical protein
MSTRLRSRLGHLEAQTRRAKRPVMRVGTLKKLPDDYVGPRHVIDVDRTAPHAPGEAVYDFEERPGPEPRGSRFDTPRIYILPEGMNL